MMRWCTAAARSRPAGAGCLAERMAAVGLELHPDKTHVVYCKDADRRGDQEDTSFTFLGYMFASAAGATKDGLHVHLFLPAISKDALKKIGAGGAVLAAAPAHRDDPRRTSPG